MGKRRKARETVMSYLYQTAITKNPDMPSEEFWKEADVDKEVKLFASKILIRAIENKDHIDALIQKYALHWKIERIAAVDLATLRAAIAEMLYFPSTPVVVVIDEAVEIAKKYSTPDSGGFVNGILDKIKHEVVDTDASRKT